MLANRFFLTILTISLTLLAPRVHAEQILEGYTIVNGKGYAFELQAPHNWILDNAVGQAQGLNVVFYPKNSNWDSSGSVCYAQVRTFDQSIRSIDAQVKATVKTYRAGGNPFAQSDFQRSMITQDGSQAKIYYYSGLQSGTLYASAYLLGKNSINFITLSARTQKDFKASIPAFDSIVASYEDISKKRPPFATPPNRPNSRGGQ
jgi:hypothetical protein